MSQTPGQDPAGGIDPARSAPRRSASVTLRQGGAIDQSDGLDPANQSLAEALTLVSRVLNLSMLVLAVVFVLSGLTSIKANEVGIRLLFGRMTGDRLPPGFQFSYPYPLGEMERVDTGLVTLELNSTFWPQLSDPEKGRTIQELVNGSARPLRPGDDGSNITGDQNIAHTKWQVVYQREDPGEFVRTILRTDEQKIVGAAVERGVVHALAHVKIDDLLRPTEESQRTRGAEGSIEARARDAAQKFLDRVHSGIRITSLKMQEKIPPLAAYNDFAGVQSAEQKRLAKKAEAEASASNELNKVAGEASAALIEQIDAYENAIAAGDVPAQTIVFESIRSLLDGKPTQVGGRTINPSVSGSVAQTLNDAREYSSSVVSRKRAELAAFQSKLAQFRTNPAVVVQREWADAMSDFLKRDNVEIQSLPLGVKWYRLMINRDPVLAKKLEQARKEREAKDADKRRAQELEQNKYRTSTEGPMKTN